MARRISPLRDFLSNESSSGVLLVIAAGFGLLVANSPWSDSYFSILSWRFVIDIPGIYLKLTTLKFINYCLMTIFFFVVGLEIKRELTSGNLVKLRQAAAPLVAALGGMAVPALCYLAIAGSQAPNGWAVPVATDIALAVGVLALMGKKITQGLKTFLLALAVIDDIGAILIIAIIYSTGVLLSWVIAAILAVVFVLALQRLKVERIFIYLVAGLALWYFLYRSGIHPTLAGVIMGILTPAAKSNSEDVDLEDGELSLVEYLEHRIHPISSFIVIPIFAFANSGVELSLTALTAALNSKIAWGIAIGLIIGKPIGIFCSSLIASRAGWTELPEGASKSMLYATGSTAGIGFTVAIFIAKLAFADQGTQDLAIMAIIIGSIVSALVAAIIFRFSARR